MGVEFQKLLQEYYSNLFPAMESLDKLSLDARNYVERVKVRFLDQPERYARFSQQLREAAAQMIERVDGGSGSPAIRLKDIPDGAVERIRACVEDYDDLVVGMDSFLRSKFTSCDRVLGEKTIQEKAPDEPGPSGTKPEVVAVLCEEPSELVLMVEEAGLNMEVVNRWCSFVTRVGDRLSSSGRSRDEFFRQLCNFSQGLINRAELCVVVTDMIGQYADLMGEFVSNLPPLHNDEVDNEDEDASEDVATMGSKISKSKGSSDVGLHKEEDARKPKRRRLVEEARQDSPSLLCKRCSVERKRSRRRGSKEDSPREITSDEEDEMVHMEVLHRQLLSARKLAEKCLAGKSNYGRQSLKKVYLQRFVKDMYGDRGQQVLAMVEEDPQATLTMVLSRLNQKKEDLEEFMDHIRSCIRKSAFGK